MKKRLCATALGLSLTAMSQLAIALPKCTVNPQIAEQYQSAKQSKRENSIGFIEIIRHAAFQGHATAAYDLGALYINGKFVPKNYRLAYQWFQVGAARGQHHAMYRLAKMNRRGTGRPVNLPAAYAWYRLAGKYRPAQSKPQTSASTQGNRYHLAARQLRKKMTSRQVMRGKRLMHMYEKDIVCQWPSVSMNAQQ